MAENYIKCNTCGSSFNHALLLEKHDNDDRCPLCGENFVAEEEHPEWVTWYYYKINDSSSYLLHDEPIHLGEFGDRYSLVREFKAPPSEACHELEEIKEILRIYEPDAFIYEKESEQQVSCPRCKSKKIQLVPKKINFLTGFLVNRFDCVCMRCLNKF